MIIHWRITPVDGESGQIFWPYLLFKFPLRTFPPMMIAEAGSGKPDLKKQFTSTYSEVSPSTRMSQKRSPILTEASFFRPPLLSMAYAAREPCLEEVTNR